MKKTYFLLMTLSIASLGFAQIAESNIVAGVPPLPIQQNINYSPTYVTASGLNFGNSVIVGAFDISDGGADGFATTLNSIEFAITNSENIAAIAIYDFFTKVAEVTTINPTTNFTGLSLTAPDGSTKQFLVFVSFKSAVTDNQQIQLTINNTTTLVTGSSFIAPDAGGATTSTAGDDNRIEVTASQFQFDQQPTDGNELEVMGPFPTLIAVDANLNKDLDIDITGINVTSAGSLLSETYDMTGGQASLNNVVFTSTEIGVTLIATSTLPNYTATSDSFNINGPLITIAEQDFDSATSWSYVSNISFFGSVPDWADNAEAYFNEIALTDASPINNSLFSNEIFGENFLNKGLSSSFFTVLRFADIDVSGLTNLQIEFDWQVVDYRNNRNDIQYRLVLDGDLSAVWQFVFNGSGASTINDGQGRLKIAVPDGNSTAGIQIRLRNNLANSYSGFDNFKLVSEFNGLIYTDAGAWKDNIVPDATTGALDALVIDGTYTVSDDVQIANLIINSGATTIIDFGKSVTTDNVFNNGTLELTSISNNYSSLIVSGTVANEVTYFRHVNKFQDTGSISGENDLISAPVTNASQTFAILNAANPIPSGLIGGVPSFLFGPFDNNAGTQGAYINYSASDNGSVIASGIGYRTASNTPSGSNFRFVGDVETGTKTVPIAVGLGSNFNLIGNPYPSYISLSDFLFANNGQFDTASEGVYAYVGNITNGFTVFNQAYIDDGNELDVIAPGQGFFVSSQVGGGTITFSPEMRSIGTSDDYIPNRAANPNLAHLKLQLSNGNALYNTDFYFNDNASLGMDPGYDSALFESTTPNFAMYSHLVENNSGRDMAVQSVSYSDLDNVTIPLGINVVQGEQATVSILESDISEGTTVILEDNVSNTFTELQTGDYTFTPTTSLSETGRFFLHFSREQLNVSDNILSGLEIYTNPSTKTIVIKGQLEAQTKVQLYDIQGRLVSATALDSNNTEHTLDVSQLSAGVYVVQLQNTAASRTQKVILR